MKRNDYLRLREEWRRKRDELLADILKDAPSLTTDEARVIADKMMGGSARQWIQLNGKHGHQSIRAV